jgi:hypothetical protein
MCCGALAAGPALAGGAGHHRTSAQNRRAAVRDADRLVKELSLPSGATASTSDPGRLGGSPAHQVGNVVDRHGWWTSSESPTAVLGYVKSHPPAGGQQTLSGQTEQCQPGQFPPSHCTATSRWIGFSLPAKPGVLGTRRLLVEVVQLSDGSTGIRADAQVQWIIPRPRSERVPSGVRVIDVERTGSRPLSRAITDPAQVRRIVALIDRLPTLQPGVWNCPAIRAQPGVVRFIFRDSRHGAALARASVRATVGSSDTGCDAMGFSIRDQRQTALVRARHFLRSVGRLLDVQLTEPGNSY